MTSPEPPDPRAALARAIDLFQGGEHVEAEAALRAIVAGAPEAVDAIHLLGLVRAERGDVAEATSLLERALVLAPGVVDIRRNLGNLLLAAGELAGAEACFREVVARVPGEIAARGALALVLERRDRVGEAIDVLRALVALAPTDADALALLARLLRRARRHEEEVAVALELVRLRPDDEALHAATGRSFFLWFDQVDDDPVAAARVLAAWTAFDPDDPVARHMTALHAARAGASGHDRPSDATGASASSYDDVLAALGLGGGRRGA